MQLFARDAKHANQAAHQAMQRITNLEKVFSDYDPESEARKLCRNDSAAYKRMVPVSAELWTVVSRSQQISQSTMGAFDVTVGSLTRLLRRSRRRARPTSERSWDAAEAAADYRHLKVNSSEPALRLAHPNMRLDFGGIAKGFIADEALKVLRRHGCGSALVDAGGDLAIGDPPPQQEGWRVGVSPSGNKDVPSAWLCLTGCGIATSGDAGRDTSPGKSHMLDARAKSDTGKRWPNTVIAQDCMSADAWASAVMLLGPEGMELAREDERILGMLLVDNNGKMIRSKGWPAYESPPTQAAER